ncbi:CshA/CshB family fibrillar adhesin-related protein [Actinomyces sp. 565]|uniref:CshA/CshB family fibrillar adhesin-related protein n=1 Tax=Actinomyces sp. 565 TaxID=2057794 RepID=UPI0013A68ED1|nr:hypothetical protein [Actinomyces sp. 565]
MLVKSATARIRKVSRRAAAVLACTALAAVGAVAVSPAPADAAEADGKGLFATGGEGRFKNDIQWIQWGSNGETLLNSGDGLSRPVTNTRDLGVAGTLVTTCTISSLRANPNEQNRTHQSALKVYTPGTWAGDSLDDLYNIGGTGYWRSGSPGDYPDQYANANTMAIGLINDTDHANLSFNFECSATLNGQPVPLQGLVFADAEASSVASGYQDETKQSEWIQAAPRSNTPVTWYALDRYRNDGCTTDVLVSTYSQTNWWNQQTTNFMRMTPNGQECVYASGGKYENPSSGVGPGAVMFMKGATSAGVQIQGRGFTAVALGVVIETDFGDAPESYGVAGALFQPSWTTGTALTNANNRSVWGMTLADITNEPPSTVHLGTRIDSEVSQHFSDGADGDDTNGVNDDEDALDNRSSIQQGAMLPIDVLNGDTSTYTINGVACGGDGKIQGWIDWNGDGEFQDNEGSNTQACPASGRVNLTFNVPQAPVDTNLVNKTVTYLRLRASTHEAESKPTGVTVGGEVEDYLLNLPAQLRLVKEVSNNYGGTATAADWDLTAKTGNTTLTYTSGQTRYVSAGDYALAEAAKTDAANAGYELESLACTQGAVGPTPPTTTVAGVSKDNPRVTTANATLTVCTFTNADQPGSITWHKVDDSGQDLEGTEWALTGPGVPEGTIVTDCTGRCSNQPFTDQDAAASHFKLTDLAWGTYTLTEHAVPTGYQLDETPIQIVVGPDSEDGLDVDHGDIKNKRVTGSVSWQKTDADNGKALSGSEWQLTLPGTGEPVTITDCVADSADACAQQAGDAEYYDSDPAAGAFKVTGLAWNADTDYAVAESKAPAGYVLDTTSHTFRILPDELDYSFATAFTNKKTTVPGLPLTGGLGADTFLIGGGVLAALALAAGLVRRRRALNVQS